MDFDDKHDEGYAKRKKTIILGAAAAAIGAEHYSKMFLTKEPYRRDSLRGVKQTESIIGVSDKTSRSLIRMSKRAFFSLCKLVQDRGLLHDTRSVQVEEQLVMFLQTIGHHLKKRKILLKPPSTTTHQRIAGNCRSFYPYFKDCIGAIDGLHSHAWVPVNEHKRFRDRKGNISQNILAACDFDYRFTYILAGWEGSASNSRILDDAIHREGAGKIVVPPGKYYLVDAGFANQKGFLRPYRNVRYHLKKWENSNQAPADKKELFNLRHSKLRNEEEEFLDQENAEAATPGQQIEIQTDDEDAGDDSDEEGHDITEDWEQFRDDI
ncbi:uncharacterized protein LOC122668258 [Telopea speciosissima]|uniref:uncharacterized protein LOC122668258 n=1 Tax=Telopea speciosissima TaxID=54955 RepID=UPI001CC74BD6|nr:uncharacterized protein LOC122668258 [Telopea speciosissima]